MHEFDKTVQDKIKPPAVTKLNSCDNKQKFLEHKQYIMKLPIVAPEHLAQWLVHAPTA